MTLSWDLFKNQSLLLLRLNLYVILKLVLFFSESLLLTLRSLCVSWTNWIDLLNAIGSYLRDCLTEQFAIFWSLLMFQFDSAISCLLSLICLSIELLVLSMMSLIVFGLWWITGLLIWIISFSKRLLSFLLNEKSIDWSNLVPLRTFEILSGWVLIELIFLVELPLLWVFLSFLSI